MYCIPICHAFPHHLLPFLFAALGSCSLPRGPDHSGMGTSQQTHKDTNLFMAHGVWGRCCFPKCPLWGWHGPYDSRSGPQDPDTTRSLGLPVLEATQLHARLQYPNDMQISGLRLAETLGKAATICPQQTWPPWPSCSLGWPHRHPRRSGTPAPPQAPRAWGSRGAGGNGAPLQDTCSGGSSTKQRPGTL